MSGFWQLSFELGARDPDSTAECCFELGATSVTYVDAYDDPVLEPLPGEFRLWPTTRLRALFPDEADTQAIARALADTLGIPADGLRTEHIEDRVWEREWLRDFHAMRFGQRLWICPHHEQVTEPGAIVVHMDPGLAFGTGTHPTTALCLEWLDALDLNGKTITDYGCGSGILAIAALKLGAASAIGVDNDPQALTASIDNAERNDVADRLAVFLPEDIDAEPADVFIANILAGPLGALAPTFAAAAKPGAPFAISGILDGQQEELLQRYAEWFDELRVDTREDWVRISGRRRA